MKDLIDIWLYIDCRGKIQEIPACMQTDKSRLIEYFTASAIDRDNYTFIREVSKEPGMLFNHAVWFNKQDFYRAKKIFMTDYAESLKMLYMREEDLQTYMSLMDKQKDPDRRDGIGETYFQEYT